MAARFDGSTDVLSVSASGLGSSAVTMCCWVYIDTDRNADSSFMGADDGSANWALLAFSSDGTTLTASSTSGFATGVSHTVGAWYFVASVYDPSGTDTLYWGLSTAASLSSAASSPNPLSGFNNAWTFRIGNNGFTEWLNGRVQHARVWTAALTAADLERERWAYFPRTANLWGWWPLDKDGQDYSGNARHLTAGGTVTQVNGAPIGLGAPELTTVTAAAGAQTTTAQIATLTLTGVQGTSSNGGASTTAQVATLTLTGVQGTSTGGAVTKVAQVATLTLTGVQGVSRNGLWPTTVSGDSRYLLDQNSGPWLAVGDTCWGIVGSLTDAQIEDYLDNRAAKGINLVLFSAPEAFYAPLAPNNVDNVAPFTGTAFQSTLNNTYWNRVDLLVAYAARLGITCLICPFYLGYDGGSDGWASAVVAANNTQMATYAGYLHARYGTAPNVMWLIGHDKIPTATEVSRADAFLTALQGAGNTQLWTFGGWHPRDVGGTDTWGFGSEDWAASSHTPDFDTQYDYSEQIAVNAYTMFGNSPPRPFLFFEGKYEQEQSIGIGDVLLREQLWAAWCAGACGVIFGNNPIWNFENNPIFGFTGTWETNLDEDGSLHLAVFADIASAVTGWNTTAADSGSTFVTNQGSGTDRIAARFDGDVGLVYSRVASSFTLDLTEMTSSSVRVRRFDPTTGTATTVGTYSNTGTQAIPHPGNNAAGAADWVYLIEPSSAQTTVAQPAVLNLTGVQGTSVPGAVTQTAQIASVTLTAVAGTSVPGAVTTSAQAATLALTAVPGVSTVGGATTVAQPGTLVLTAIQGTTTTGPATTTAQPATLTLTAVPGVSTTGLRTTAQIATLTLTAVQGTSTTGAVTTTAQPATIALTGVPGSSVIGGITTTAQPATLTLTAVPGSSSLGGQTTVAEPGVLTFSAIPGVSTTGAVATVAQAATLTLTAVPGVTYAGAIARVFSQTIIGREPAAITATEPSSITAREPAAIVGSDT